MKSQRSKIAKRHVICFRTPPSKGFGNREVKEDIVGLHPAKDHSVAFREFKGHIIARLEAQAFTDFFRNPKFQRGVDGTSEIRNPKSEIPRVCGR